MKLKKVTAMLLVGILASSAMAGCGKKDTAEQSDNTISIWCQGSSPIGEYSDPNTFPGMEAVKKAIKEETGADIEFVFPSIGQEQQQFNLLVASQEMPDIVSFWWYDIPGGVEKAIEDKLIYPMDAEFLEKNAPDFKKMLDENEALDKACKTDNGTYFTFPYLMAGDVSTGVATPTNGYMMRADWLKELNLEIPETYDEWYTTLKAFKEKKGASAPFSLNLDGLGRGFGRGFGFMLDFYHDDGTVKYGRYEDNYKVYLETLNKWYSEGLLDTNLPNLDSKMVTAKILNGDSGATFGWVGSGMGVWLKTAEDPDYDLVGVPFPVLNKGEVNEYGNCNAIINGNSAIINAKSKNPELAAKVLNFAFSEKGHMLANFGTEGQTYIVEDGYPKYTDLITNNPDGLSMSEAKTLYTASATKIAQEDSRYLEQYYSLPQQKQAQEAWNVGNGYKHMMPRTTLTAEENAEYSKIMNDVKTYVDEMQIKFIVGAEPLSKFDDYKAELKKIGIERAIELKQAAFDRYESR